MAGYYLSLTFKVSRFAVRSMVGIPLYQEALRFLFATRLKLKGTKIEEQGIFFLLLDER